MKAAIRLAKAAGHRFFGAGRFYVKEPCYGKTIDGKSDGCMAG